MEKQTLEPPERVCGIGGLNVKLQNPDDRETVIEVGFSAKNWCRASKFLQACEEVMARIKSTFDEFWEMTEYTRDSQGTRVEHRAKFVISVSGADEVFEEMSKKLEEINREE